jgi:hypothetical protein
MISKDTHRRGKALALLRPRALGKQAVPAPKHVQVNPSEAPAEMLVATPGAEASSSIAVNLAAGNSLPNGDEADSRMSQIKEILGHAAMRFLDKGELVAEWVRYAEAKVSGQVVQKPQGGRPEGGITRAARELPVPGKTEEARRKLIERAIKINTISPEAKAEARAAGLHNIQSALLAIAEEHSPDAQIAKVQEIVARRVKPRRRKKSTSSAGNESGSILTEVERLKTELVVANDRKRELEQELEIARGMAARTSAVEGLVKAPTTDEDIPAFLDRRPLSPGDQLTLDAVMAAWADAIALRAALLGASPVVQERFVAALREDIASASSPVM